MIRELFAAILLLVPVLTHAGEPSRSTILVGHIIVMPGGFGVKTNVAKVPLHAPGFEAVLGAAARRGDEVRVTGVLVRPESGPLMLVEGVGL